jgi:hypothetical protein
MMKGRHNPKPSKEKVFCSECIYYFDKTHALRFAHQVDYCKPPEAVGTSYFERNSRMTFFCPEQNDLNDCEYYKEK